MDDEPQTSNITNNFTTEADSLPVVALKQAVKSFASGKGGFGAASVTEFATDYLTWLKANS